MGGSKAGKSCLGVADVTMKRNSDCLVQRGEKSHRYCNGSAQSPLAVVTRALQSRRTGGRGRVMQEGVDAWRGKRKGKEQEKDKGERRGCGEVRVRVRQRACYR